MKEVQIILTGVGGQGILFSTKLLSETAIFLGNNVIGSETHGMSQRGGSVISHLKVGNFNSPLVSTNNANILFSLEKDETYRTLHFLDDNSTIFYNANEPLKQNILDILAKRNIKTFRIDANKIALEMNTPLLTNVILLGFSCANALFPFTYEQLKGTIERISPAKFKEANLLALEKGAGDR